VDGATTGEWDRWASAWSDPQWIYVDLQSTYNINEVDLYWESAYASSYQIQVSADATNWISIYSTATGIGGTNYLTGLSGTGRYVRMYGTVRGTGYGYSLFEIEVFGTVPTIGGAYTTIANMLATSYTNSGLPNGTTYYYQVSALNSFSESTNSAAVSATPTNHPPVLAVISNQTILAGRTLLVTNSASDADLPAQILTYGLASAPTNAVINPNSGLFSWRPTIAQSPSTQAVAVVVSDNGVPSMSATQSFAVMVTRPAVPILSVATMAKGPFGFWINGDAGPDYTVQVSTNLTSWNQVFNSNSPALPFFWTDNSSSSYPFLFYRVLLGP
jgi:hypothetical protein